MNLIMIKEADFTDTFSVTALFITSRNNIPILK